MSRAAVAVCIGLIGGVFVLGTAAGAKKDKKKGINPGDITCAELVAMGEEVQPRVIYWMEGFSETGKPDEVVVGMDAFVRPITIVVDECEKDPKESVLDKVKKYF